MICLDCGNMDIRFDENEKAYHCNNCGSRNLGKRKEGCIHMRDNGLCGKNPTATSSGECEVPCSYYESINSVDWCIIVAYNISTIISTVLSTERGAL